MDILWLLLVILVHHGLWALIGLWKKDNTYADYGWATGATVLVLTASLLSGPLLKRHWVVMVLVFIWSIRLLYVVSQRHTKEDQRYAAYRKKWKDKAAINSLIYFYGMQAALLLFITSPAWFIMLSRNNVITGVDILGVLVWAIGFIFEAVGDAQLAYHKKHGAGLLTSGLWRFTRHPNYFGEVTQWTGLWILSISAGGIYTFVGPLLLYFLIRYFSGVTRLEKILSKKRGWNTYKKRTNQFWPGFPKR